jgi:glycosyltransferase involved in cell wall biosynthesis
MALITIVVPTYNRLDLLDQALASIRAQTFADYEVVVADDAGPTNPLLLLNDQDPRERYLRRETNIGAASNIWSVMATATSKYVVTLNDDDLWEPEFLNVLVTALEENEEATVSFCDFWHVDANNQILADVTEASSREFGRADLTDGLHKPFIYKGVWERSIPAAMGAVFRHSAIDWSNLPDEVGTFYDEWLAYLAVRKGGAVWYTSRRLSRYRVHSGSETGIASVSIHTTVKWRAQEEFISRAKFLDPLVRECHEHLRRKNRRALIGLAVSAVIVGQKELARSRINASANLHPRWVSALLLASLNTPSIIAKNVLAFKHLFR